MIAALRYWGKVGGVGLCLGLTPAMTPIAQADDYDWMLRVLDNTRIGEGVGAGASGNVAINTAAGDGNLQSNQRQIQAGGAIAAMAAPPLVGVRPQPQNNSGNAIEAQSEIAGQAFSHAAGVLGINQASGAANAQVNSMSMGGSGHSSRGIRAAGSVMPNPPSNPVGQKSDRPAGNIPDRYRAVINEGALSGFSGVLQINQVSGIGNVTANHFSISMP